MQAPAQGQNQLRQAMSARARAQQTAIAPNIATSVEVRLLIHQCALVCAAKDGLPSSLSQGIAADHIQLDPSYLHRYMDLAHHEL